MTSKRNNLVAKNFGKKKCLKLGLKRYQIITRCCQWADGSRDLVERWRKLSRRKSSSYNLDEMSVERMKTEFEVNAWNDDERVDLEN